MRHPGQREREETNASEHSAPEPNPRGRLVHWAWLLALALASLWIFLGAVWIAVVGYAPTPFWDEWDNVTTEQLINHFFSPHNEHRIVVARILILADIWLTQNLGMLKLGWTLLISLGHLLVLVMLFRRAFPSARAGPRILFWLVGTSLFFSGFQYANFTWGFQVQFVGVFFFASAACALVALAVSKVGPQRTILAILAACCALLSTGSMANGLLIWLILPPLAVLTGLGWRWTLGYATIGALIWPLYLVGLDHHKHPGQSVGGQSLAQFLTDPVATLAYTLSYLGGSLPQSLHTLQPATQLNQLTLSAGAGLLACLLLTLAICQIRVQKSLLKPATLALIGAAAFVALSAAITATGRIDLGVTQSFSSRYGAGPAAFWTIALGLLLLSNPQPIVKRIAAALATGGVVVLALAQPVWIASAGNLGVRKTEAQAALLSGVFLPDVLKGVYPDPEKPYAKAKILRARKQTLFAYPYARLVGQSLESPPALCPNQESPRASYRVGIPQGVWRITLDGAIPGATAIALVGHDYRVDSLLIRGLEEDLASRSFSKQVVPVWAGFLPDKSPDGEYLAMAVDRYARPICQLQSPLVVDPSNRITCPTSLAKMQIASEGAGWLDSIRRKADNSITLGGWAADLVARKSARLVVAVIGQQVVACGTPNIARPDVAAAVMPSLEKSGFMLSIAKPPEGTITTYALQTGGGYAPLASNAR